MIALAGKDFELRYLRVYYACLCHKRTSYYRSDFYIELIRNGSGFLDSTNLFFRTRVPKQFFDIEFMFENSTYNRLSYPGDNVEQSPWMMIDDGDSCGQEIWEAKIPWTLMNTGENGGVFPISSIPVYDDDGMVIDFATYERMWAFTLIMKGTEIFEAQEDKI
eukprot:UN31303